MEYNVKLLDMDCAIPEQVIKNNDDSYTIILNSRLSSERQFEAYLHAIKHITGNDFNKNDADRIEFDSHNSEIALELCSL